MIVNLEGHIESVTYADEETGFTIAKVRVSGQKQYVTVVGHLLPPSPGEILKMRGEWIIHPRFGKQFKIQQYETSVPASIYGIQKYLGSGLIKGIGPVMAGRLVKKFGKRTLEVIENESEKLAEVEGIGIKRIEFITKAWKDQKDIRNVMLFLQSHDVSIAHAVKIFRQYGNRSLELLRNNPYRLATDIHGIGFATADGIAEKLGFAKDSELRAGAGILYVLNQLADQGHVYYPYGSLLDRSHDILDIDRSVLIKAFSNIELEKRIVIEDLNIGIDGFQENNKAVYLKRFHISEVTTERFMKKLANTPKSITGIDSGEAIEWVQKQLSITLAENQVEAVRCALENKIMVITGGPGTGKTTIINAILKIFLRHRARVSLAAPTGRAAKRMAESTSHEAMTIHRMLEYSFRSGGFRRNEERPLSCDLMIVDETSMIDSMLMHYLLKAIPSYATLILVGDVNQLPSVGPGNVLHDIIESHYVPVVELNEIFRQAKESLIITNAHRINSGILPELKSTQPNDDFFFIEKEDPEDVLKIILELAKDRIPKRFGLDPVDDIQILTPMYRGTVGAGNLNSELQNLLNPREERLFRGNREFRINDKVMQIINNYDKEVFNGDIGKISEIDLEDQTVSICFDGRDVTYDFTDLDEIVLAYAISVHKSQGSEYPAVIIPVLTQHYMLLQRNLIYTAVTRARRLAVIVGTRKAFGIGVRNNKTQKRYTYLRHRLG